jgi:hypothetical protein
VQGGGQGHRRGVGAAAAHGGDVPGLPAHALEAGHDRDIAGIHGILHAVGGDIDDPGVSVQAVREHAGLRASEGLGGGALRVDAHGEQGHGDALAGGEQDVHLAGRRLPVDLFGQVQQLIGGVTHRGDHHHHLVAGLLGFHHALGHAEDPFGIGDGGSAVLLDDQTHARTSEGVDVPLSAGWQRDCCSV